MATGTSIKEPQVLCNICEQRNIFDAEADIFCPECDESFCVTCADHHRISKLSRSHKTVTLKDHNQIPSFVSQTKQSCPTHDLRYEMYCQKHEEPCCLRCISENHCNCGTIKPLDDFVKNIKTSEQLSDIEKNVNEVTEFVSSVQMEHKNQFVKLEKQIDECIKQKNTTHQALLDHINRIDKILEDEIKSKKEMYKTVTDNIITNLEIKKETLKGIEDSIGKMKNFASDRQIFLSLNVVEASVQTEKKDILQLVNEANLYEITLLEPEQSSFLDNLSCGKLEQKEVSIKSVLKHEKEVQAQIFTKTPVTINNVKAKLTAKVKILKGNVLSNLVGCAIMENDTLVFADDGDNKRLIVMRKSDFKIIKQVQFHEDPLYVAKISDNEIVCTTSSALCIVNLKEGTVAKQFKDDSKGVAYFGNHIILGRGKRLQRLDRNGFAVSFEDILQDGHDFMTCTTNGYITKHADSIYCFNESGTIEWQYSNSKLKTPQGVCLDQYSNLYVAGFETGNITVISADGKQSKELVTNLKNPTGVHFNNRTSELLVCADKDFSLLYTIEY